MAVAENVTRHGADLVAHLYRRAGSVPAQRALVRPRRRYGATVAPWWPVWPRPTPAPTPSPRRPSEPGPRRRARGHGRGGTARPRPASCTSQFAELTALVAGRMVATTNPLQEKLTFLLHGHFPTAISKVRFPLYMYGQNQLFRTQGGGRLRPPSPRRSPPTRPC